MSPIVQVKNKQKGAVSTEWTATTLILIAALFVPVGANGQSAMGMMMSALQSYQKNNALIYSLP